jgi:hypothetical protein
MKKKLLLDLNLEEIEYKKNTGLETGFARNAGFFTRNNMI